MKKLFSIFSLPFAIIPALVASEKPNVVFIAIDDLNDWVGCMGGHPQVKTPNIDLLAKKSMLFTNANCQAPISGPSRASVMTGIQPFNSGNYFQLGDGDIKKANMLTREAIFLPDYFELFGYKTMGVGKILHNGDKAKVFDEFGGVFSMYGPTPEKRFKYDPAWFEEKTGNTQTDWGAFPENDSLMTDYKSAAWAVRKLKEKHEKPFFLAIGFIRPHVPWYVPQEWFDMFPASYIKTPPYKPNDMDDVPEFGRQVADVPMMPTTEWAIQTKQWKDMVQAYLACIAFVDAQVGKVIDALEKSEYKDNTIVVLWSDHGYHLGEKGRFAKQAIWERDTRTPLIIHTPAMKCGTSANAPVGLIDIYPTLTDLCGLPRNKLAEGNSLMPLLDNPNAEWSHVALSTYGIGNIAIRDKQYRFIQYEDGSQELYDMINDPNEWKNLAGKRKYKNVKSALSRHIPAKWEKNSAYSTNNVNNHFKKKYK